jgi:hypothetical protein
MPFYAIPIQVVTTLLVGIRFISRLGPYSVRPGLDDVLIFIAWTLGTLCTALALYGEIYNRYIQATSNASIVRRDV